MRYVVIALFIPTLACRSPGEPGRACVSPLEPGVSHVCTIPGWPDREVVIRVPADSAERRPLVLALHGGGGRKEGMDEVTCRDGRAGDPSCLSVVAAARGVVMVTPDGLANRMGRRGWNDGPERGEDGQVWRCGHPCEEGVDDVAYLGAVLDEVARLTPIDTRRVYATGLSNGAGMSHRLACELADRVTAVAAIGGGNRFAATRACTPRRPVPVLQVHGDADPVWPYLGGESGLALIGGRYPSVPASIVGGGMDPGWVSRNRCGLGPEEVRLPDTTTDGTTSRESIWRSCAGEVEVRFITVEGGGHAWPGGHAYLADRVIGRVSSDFSASERALDFLLRWSLPN